MGIKNGNEFGMNECIDRKRAVIVESTSMKFILPELLATIPTLPWLAVFEAVVISKRSL